MQCDASYMPPNLGFYCKKYAQPYFSQVSAKTLITHLGAFSFHSTRRKEVKQNPGKIDSLSI